MAAPVSNLDSETVCVDHGSLGNIIQIRERAAEGRVVDLETINEHFREKNNRSCSSRRRRFCSRCSFPCVWASCTTVLFLIVSIVGIVTFLQLSTEMDELREQFTVGGY